MEAFKTSVNSYRTTRRQVPDDSTDFQMYSSSYVPECDLKLSSVHSILFAWCIFTKRKCKAIPVTGRGGPYGFEMSRLPHFLDNRLTDCGEVVSLTSRRPLLRGKIPGTHFC
jgi:hypothetical protein